MSLEKSRKSYETHTKTESPEERRRRIFFESQEASRKLKDMIDDLEYEASSDEKVEGNPDMDLEWIRNNEISKGKINQSFNIPDDDFRNDEFWSSVYEQEDKNNSEEEMVNDKLSGLEQAVNEIEEENISLDPVNPTSELEQGVEEKEEEVNNIPLEFTEYAKSLMEKYNANDYHRMMNAVETNKFVDLYSKAYGVDRRDALEMVEDTINKQLNSEKSDSEIRKQGLEQEKLMLLSEIYQKRHGNNFLAVLSDEDLETYSKQYLHAYNVRRSHFDKMYQDSLNNAYADK